MAINPITPTTPPRSRHTSVPATPNQRSNMNDNTLARHNQLTTQSQGSETPLRNSEVQTISLKPGYYLTVTQIERIEEESSVEDTQLENDSTDNRLELLPRNLFGNDDDITENQLNKNTKG